MPSPAHTRIVKLVLLSVLFCQAYRFGPVLGQTSSQLSPETDVDFRIRNREVQNHTISLEQDQFLSLIVTQRALAFSVKVYSPNGTMIFDSPLGGLWYQHLIEFIAPLKGQYRLEIAGEIREEGTQTLRIRVGSVIAAGENERLRVRAMQLVTDARLALGTGTESDLHTSIDKVERARELFREAGDRHGEGVALNFIGRQYWRLNDRGKALEFLKEALAEWRALNEYQEQVVVLTNIGDILKELDRAEEAVEHYNASVSAARQLGDPKLEIWQLYYLPSYAGKIGTYLRVLELARTHGIAEDEAMALVNIGVVYQEFGDSEEAISYFTQALNLSPERTGRDFHGNVTYNIGFVRLMSGNYAEAVTSLSNALPYLNENFPAPFCRTLYFLGEAYEGVGEIEKAKECYERIGAVREAALRMTPPRPPVVPYPKSLTGLARVAIERGERDVAATVLEEALKSADRIPPMQNRGKCDVYFLIADAFEKLGAHERSLDALRRALDLSRSIKVSDTEAESLFRIAQVKSRSGALSSARDDARGALDLIESTRAGIGDLELRGSYIASLRKRYELVTDTEMRLHRMRPDAGHARAALTNSERGKARVLLDLLREARAEIRQGVDADLIAKQKRLLSRLNAKANERSELLLRKDPRAKGAIEDQLVQLNTEMRVLEAEIRARSPRYAALTMPQPIGLDAIQSRLLDSDTTLLEYELGKERSYLWVVTRDSLESFELPARDVIETASRRFYGSITERGGNRPGESMQARQRRVAAADLALPDAAAVLGRMVLPISKKPSGKRLLVVADGALHYVPFAALPGPGESGRGRPLIVDYEIVMLPSVSVLDQLREEAGRRPPPKLIATLADPVFEKDDPRVRSGSSALRQRINVQDEFDGRQYHRAVRDVGSGSQDFRLSRLPFTRDEAKAIVELAPKGSSLAAVDFEATRAMAMDSRLSQYRILHFATHALIDAEHPALSGVVFSMFNAAGEPEEGFLRLNEIYNLRLPADLVVLSACQTALGKNVAGEGLVGLTRGFMYAGASRVVASLWNINDSASADLMKAFYREMLTNGHTPAAALRKAQLQKLQQSQWKSPYYWAGFALHGEYR